MWQPSILETYGNQTTNYTNQILGPMRKRYPKSMGERELMTSLTKVYSAFEPSFRSNHLFVVRMMCTTTPMKRTSPSWTSSLENQPFLVSCNVTRFHWNFFAPEFERSPKMTWLDFISGFGGICGLCLGISFVSVVEILYWFSIRLCKKFWFKTNIKVAVFAIL